MIKYPHFHSISLAEFAQQMIIVLWCAFQNKKNNDVINQDLLHMTIGGSSLWRRNQSSSTTLQRLPCHHIVYQVFWSFNSRTKIYYILANFCLSYSFIVTKYLLSHLWLFKYFLLIQNYALISKVLWICIESVVPKFRILRAHTKCFSAC